MQLKENNITLPQYKDVRHMIESGALIYTYLDLETTDKDWKTAEITVASLTITDIGFNLISDELFEVFVPDRVGLSPEAMLITRYMASKLRDKSRIPPQIAAARIVDAIQDAPRRLWCSLDDWRENMSEVLWNEWIDERIISIPGKDGADQKVRVRHYPTLDEQGNILKRVRIHEPSINKSFVDMSYMDGDQKNADYKDSEGYWKIRRLDKFNMGFRNTFFDNRLLAAALFRANFPLKEIYALSRKALGNHSADVFTLALSDHFFNSNAGNKIKLGQRIDPETTREKISAKLDLLMDENTRFEDAQIDQSEGVRIADGSLHNQKRGHNAPDYDNAKSIGLHAYLRKNNPSIVEHIERCANIDYFRRFMTYEDEDGVPTTHPIRFGIISANDDQIYRAVPLIILGSDDQHGKFNKIWAVRADIDFEVETFKGKKIPDMSVGELSELIALQKGQPQAYFHEIHLKRHRGVFDLDTGLKAGHAQNISVEALRYRRDSLVDYLDDRNLSFVDKALDAFSLQYSFAPPADDLPQPYAEEEIWTAMGDIKYPFVTTPDGKKVKLPNVIREMAQDEFKKINDKIGDCIRNIIRPHPLEWSYTIENALLYARTRAMQEKKLDDYQSRLSERDKVKLIDPYYPYTASEILRKKTPEISIADVYATLLQDRAYLMDKLPETTRAYEVQQQFTSTMSGKKFWQTIPFNKLADISESRLLNLKDEGRLRIVFEKNSNSPAYRFAIRQFIESGLGDILNASHKEFYMAETSFYVNGPPYIADPEKHRVMSASKVQLSIDAIRQNIFQAKKHLSATREGENGAYSRFANDNFAESILNNVEIDKNRRVNQYPYTRERKIRFGLHTAHDTPLFNVKYTLDENITIINVPDLVPSQPASHPSFGHTCFVVPYFKTEKNTEMVLREEKTGRKYYLAQPIIHEMPSRELGSFEEFYTKIDNAYLDSGQNPPHNGCVISCSEIAPITTSQDMNLPSIRVSQDRLIATCNPRMGNLGRDELLTGFCMRKYDLKLKEGQKIILRGTSGNEEESGWQAVTRIEGNPITYTLSSLLQKMDDPGCADEIGLIIGACGYATTVDLKNHVLQMFTEFDENILHPKNEIIFFRIDHVKQIDFWTPHQARAALEPEYLDKNKTIVKMRKAKLAAKSPALSVE